MSADDEGTSKTDFVTGSMTAAVTSLGAAVTTIGNNTIVLGYKQAENNGNGNGNGTGNGNFTGYGVSLYENESIHPFWRYGMPIYLIGVFAFLLASQLGSGAKAVTMIEYNAENRISDAIGTLEPMELFRVNIFESMRELWNTGGYGLAILCVVCSISWPYLKILLSLYAWMVPPPLSHRQQGYETMLVFLDVLGKWSFVDIVVFAIILVVFRSSIPLGDVDATLEVFIIPLWGYFGFVFATFMSLISVHVILYFQRRALTPDYGLVGSSTGDGDESEGLFRRDENDQNSGIGSSAKHFAHGFSGHGNYDQDQNRQNWHIVSASVILIIGLIMYVVAFFIHMFRIMNYTEGADIEPEDYSLNTVGKQIMDAGTEDDQFSMRVLQILWYFLGFATPVLSMLALLTVLYVYWKYTDAVHSPSSESSSVREEKERLRTCCLWSEILFAWSGSEVYVICVLSAVLQIPTFGSGLIESGCTNCYVIDADLLVGEFMVMLIGSLLHIFGTVFVVRVVHPHAFYTLGTGAGTAAEGADVTECSQNEPPLPTGITT